VLRLAAPTPFRQLTPAPRLIALEPRRIRLEKQHLRPPAGRGAAHDDSYMDHNGPGGCVCVGWLFMGALHRYPQGGREER